MDAPRCMKALLLAAAEYRAAKTAHNAALLQRSLEVRAAPVPGARREGGAGVGGGCGVRFCNVLWCVCVFTEVCCESIRTQGKQTVCVTRGLVSFFFYFSLKFWPA